jgi:hypothetical protein
MPHGGRKNADDAVLLALACGATAENAAKKAGVGIRTVNRRLADPNFKKRLTEIRADILKRATGVLTAATMEAVKTLMDLQKPATPAAVRLGAARTILEFGIKLRDSTEMEERIAALEAQMETRQPA